MADPDLSSVSPDAETVLLDGLLPVVRYLSAQLGVAHDAQDLVQETYLRALRALARGDRPERPVPWLLGIARHVLLEALRRRRYERQLRERLARQMGAEWDSPWEHPVERRLVVGAAVDGLPAELRDAVAPRLSSSRLSHYRGKPAPRPAEASVDGTRGHGAPRRSLVVGRTQHASPERGTALP